MALGYSTDMWPTTGGVRGEKSFGQGELCSDDGDQYTVLRTDWTEYEKQAKQCVPIARVLYNINRFNVSASDLRQEPSAVVPHAWDLYGGCRVTGIPTVTLLDSFGDVSTLSKSHAKT